MRRTVLAGLAAASVVGVTVATAALAAPDNEHAAAGRTAATWLTTQLRDGLLQNQFGDEFSPDVGLTIDALLAMKATGIDAVTVTTVTDAVARKAATFAINDIPVDTDDDGEVDTTVRTVDAGSTAKLLFAAVVSGRDPKAFGLDLDDLIRGLIATDGPHQGRVRDINPENWGGDGSNVFDQSLAVLGLAGSGGAPPDVVNFLIKQQCPAGGFRLNPATDGSACADDGRADVDATAIAVQALVAAGSDDAAGKGGDWLAGLQAANGSFRNGPQAPDPFIVPVENSNSTGLGGQALAATGHSEEAGKAAAWVAALQWTAGADRGAIAYDKEAFDAGAPDDTSRDQWRRASAQALLGLAQVPFGEISKVPAGEPSSSSPSASASASSSASSSASASSSTSASASASASATTTPTPTTTPTGNLATTGEPVMRFAIYALGLILAGAILVIAARRRRSSA
ncbi:cell wall anchor protein [Virgisporangium aurantiacum]|uniref:Prenyltransferase and squalene oxidase repeat-containing protein n=1 Tax=Virgisporangium aurantiacum TaxID=175570 RepID=A0A8J4DYA5_9ACTN|nr:cell wall anchor protein [Virgisporangium aurantiacum]GIJ52872.1 hypothetical protein Vau01_003880 [Virgisporangium aurantiacum]